MPSILDASGRIFSVGIVEGEDAISSEVSAVIGSVLMSSPCGIVGFVTCPSVSFFIAASVLY